MSNKKVHFLHIPKTAGQSVHQLLTDSFSSVSPLRLNSQFEELGVTSVTDYDVISGHIDWNIMLLGGDAKFTFTVLRDPIDRILSFYHYLRGEAKKLSRDELASPQRLGMFNALHLSPDEYFCPSDSNFKKFIDDHYDNFYTHFFSSKKYIGNRENKNNLSENEALGLAIKNICSIDKVYTLNNIVDLPMDLKKQFPNLEFKKLSHVNKGENLSTEERLNKLDSIGSSRKAKERINEMCKLDNYIYKIVSI